MNYLTFLILDCCVACFSLTTTATAQGVLIDQSNDNPAYFQTYPNSLTPWTLVVGDPVGQEFVPTLGGLDFVEAVFFSREGSSASDTLQVLIHDGSITGPVVGASSQVSFYASAGGSIQHFDFPSTVALTAGRIYVMHFFQVESQPYSIGADPAMAYTSGQMIRSGVPFAGYDLWFREGVVVPEPSPTVLFIIGVFVLIIGVRRKTPVSRFF